MGKVAPDGLPCEGMRYISLGGGPSAPEVRMRSSASVSNPRSSEGTGRAISRWSAKIWYARKYDASSSQMVSPGAVSVAHTISIPCDTPFVVKRCEPRHGVPYCAERNEARRGRKVTEPADPGV
eukprot:scaffold77236_cov39-Tisochrysis_lutea.AAC.3